MSACRHQNCRLPAHFVRAGCGIAPRSVLTHLYMSIIFFFNSFYTGVGQIVDDAVLEELNNDNGKTEVSERIFS